MRSERPVVAGIDGSPGSRVAAEFAVEEAERRGRRLRLVHGDERFSGRHSLPSDVIEQKPPAFPPEEGGSEPTRALLDRLAADIRSRHQTLEVECAVTLGDASGVLVDESKTADLLVLGSRGLGRLRGLLAGSVSEQVATHAKAPVIVLPARAESRPAKQSGPVVVGVDGSAPAAQAFGFACDEAAHRGESVVAVHAFDIPRHTRDQAVRVLDSALAERLDGSPPVEVRRLVVEASHPAEALLRVGADAGACLVVVGSRGRGGFTGLLLGSVGRALLSHSDRPVAIVHPSEP